MSVTNCASCGGTVTLSDDWRGSRFKCPHCGSVNAVAQGEPAKPAYEVVRVEDRDRDAVATGFGRGFGGFFGVMAAVAVVVAILIVVFVWLPAMGGRGKDQRRQAPEWISEQGSDNKVETGKATPVGEWCEISEVRVMVAKVELKRVPFKNPFGKSGESRDNELMVWVKIENTSPTLKLDYHRWRGGILQDKATDLADEHGNRYRLIDRDTDIIEGAVPIGVHTSHPGDPPIQDVLCFEKSVKAATRVDLSLPPLRETKDRKAAYRFTIPASAWAKK